MSVNAIPTKVKVKVSARKVTIFKSHCSHVMHVLWPILAIEIDGYVFFF